MSGRIYEWTLDGWSIIEAGDQHDVVVTQTLINLRHEQLVQAAAGQARIEEFRRKHDAELAALRTQLRERRQRDSQKPWHAVDRLVLARVAQHGLPTDPKRALRQLAKFIGDALGKLKEQGSDNTCRAHAKEIQASLAQAEAYWPRRDK